MRSLLSILICCLLTSVAFAIPRDAMPVENPGPGPLDALIQGPGDDPVPWPWGSELPFPWPFVQGVWKAEKGEFRSFFSFEIVKDKNEVRQLRVTQINPVTCEAQAHGVAVQSGNVVRAQMTGLNGDTYRLTLRSFNAQSVVRLVEIPERPINGQYVVLSVYPFEQVKGVHLPIQLISTQIRYKCLVEQ